MEAFFTYAANYGFPMAVAGYLLVRIEAKLDKLAASIGALSRAIERR